MSLPREQAWFAAKRYGYGWGLPLRWQGWVVLACYVGGMILAMPLAIHGQAWFFGAVAVLSTAFYLICRWKGEPARWRWGRTP